MKEIAEALTRIRFLGRTEAELQSVVEATLARLGLEHVREARLPGGDRPDFLLADGTAVELKTQGSSSDLLRQLARYAAEPDVKAVVVVTTRQTHTAPENIDGKPICLVRIQRRIA